LKTALPNHEAFSEIANLRNIVVNISCQYGYVWLLQLFLQEQFYKNKRPIFAKNSRTD